MFQSYLSAGRIRLATSVRGSLLFVCCYRCSSYANFDLGFRHRVTAGSPVVVQPGAPGQPTLSLPSTTRPTLPIRSAKDVEFMQGMIMHHAQAVEMTALIDSRSENKELRLLGARISKSQSDEMNFMKRWLEARGEPVSASAGGSGMSMPGMSSPRTVEFCGEADAYARNAYARTNGRFAKGHRHRI